MGWHFIIHTGDKFNLCGNVFSLKSTLNQHIRIHIGEMPFKCTIILSIIFAALFQGFYPKPLWLTGIVTIVVQRSSAIAVPIYTKSSLVGLYPVIDLQRPIIWPVWPLWLSTRACPCSFVGPFSGSGGSSIWPWKSRSINTKIIRNV